MTERLKVGFFGITGCAGCLLSVIFNEDEIVGISKMIDIKSFPFIKEKVYDGKLDVVFLEGVVANNHDLEALKKLRAQAKVLVALGACATTGGAPALRNFQDPQNFSSLQYNKAVGIADIPPQPVDRFVHVDYYIQGCPPDKKEILSVINDFVLGKKPFMYSKPVCVECRKNKNPCLLQQGKPCIGPITRGGCNAVCVNGGLVCWGCRGPASEPSSSFKTMIELLKSKGYDEKFVKDRINTFEGWKLEEESKDDEKPHS